MNELEINEWMKQVSRFLPLVGPVVTPIKNKWMDEYMREWIDEIIRKKRVDQQY